MFGNKLRTCIIALNSSKLAVISLHIASLPMRITLCTVANTFLYAAGRVS